VEGKSRPLYIHGDRNKDAPASVSA